MKLLKFGAKGSDVKALQECLKKYGYLRSIDGIFGENTLDSVKKFQSEYNLTPDGIVGFNTWDALLFNYDTSYGSKLTELDFKKAAYILSCDVACIKAVQEVETGGKGGFFEPNLPSILFEGHIFWSELKKLGINPETKIKGNEDILYKTWTKSHYLGGIKEYSRLNKAREINNQAADSSTSWGMFQIMGNNYKLCGCQDVCHFVNLMSINEGQQLRLFIRFIYNSKLGKYIQKKQWTEFAKRYNGPGYKQNQYDIKLSKACSKYSK